MNRVTIIGIFLVSMLIVCYAIAWLIHNNKGNGDTAAISQNQILQDTTNITEQGIYQVIVPEASNTISQSNNSQQVNINGQALSISSYNAMTKDRVYIVTYTKYPEGLFQKKTPDTVMSDIKKSIEQDYKATVTQEINHYEKQDRIVRELYFGANHKVQIILKPPYAFVLDFRSDAYTPTDVQRRDKFFESMQIL